MTDKLPWLALKSIPGVGPVLFQRLLWRFGQPAAVFQARREELLAVKGVNPDLAQDLLTFRAWDRVEAELARLAAAGVEVLLQMIPASRPASSRSLIRRRCLFIKGTILPEDDLAAGPGGHPGGVLLRPQDLPPPGRGLGGPGPDGGERPGPGHRHRGPPGGPGKRRPHPGGPGLRPGRGLSAGKPKTLRADPGAGGPDQRVSPGHAARGQKFPGPQPHHQRPGPGGGGGGGRA